MAALALCEQGFKVGLVERGKRFNPKQHYIQNYGDWGLRKDPLRTARRPEETINTNYATEYTLDGKQHRRSANVYFRVHGLGGSTLHYQGEAHRFAEHAFNTKSQFGWGLDWPITYQDLAPFYQRAEELLGVAGDANNPFKAKRGEYPTPAHALSPRSRILAESAIKVGMSLLPNPLALPSQSVDGRVPCQHSGGCDYGCVFGAKSSIDQAIIPRAEKTGNLSILTESRALALTLDEQNEIAAVKVATPNGMQQLSANAYVLATGAVETPRLMLTTHEAGSDTAYANTNDQVGRYFMETLLTRVQLELEADIKTYRGPPLDSRVWDYNYPMDNQTSGFVLGAAGYLNPGNDPVQLALRTPGIGHAHKEQVRASFGRDLFLFGLAEQEPQHDNRLFLSNKEDAAGVPKVNIHCEYSQRDHHTMQQMRNKLRKWAEATPNKRVRNGPTTLTRSAATHVGGTCRMGNNPAHSVVDAYGKVHGKSNCWITDASILATQGAGDSPSLTIQALALRTADRLAAELKG